MIYKKCIMTINKNNATLDEDIYLFRLDKNIELHFSIVNNRYKFDKSDLNNIIAQTNAAYFQIRLYRSDEIKYTFAIQPTQDGVAVLTITDDLINDPIELGEYDFQISLLDADKTSMISMPIVKQQLHVCEPLVDNQAIMGRAVLGLSSLASGEIKNAFDSEGNYIREIHNDGDILSAQLINKFEEALDTNTKASKDLATKKYVDDGINYDKKQFNNKIVAMNISKHPVTCSTEIYKKPLCDIFPELLNITYNTVFKEFNSFKVNMDNFIKEYPTVKSAYNKLNINLYDENDNPIGNSYGNSINGEGLNIIFINITESLRFYAYFDKALVDGSSTTMETKNGYMTIQLLIPKGNNKQEFIDKIKNLKLTLSVFRTDFLNLNNETIYTPTTDYNPATKKYVDDKVTVKILPVDYNKNCATNVADLEPHSIYMSPNDAKFLYLGYERLGGSFSGFFLSGNPHGKFIYTGAKDDTKIEVVLDGICYTAYFKTDTVDAHTEKTVYYLTKNNNKEFTPTTDYEPATKKYVDDNKIAYTISSKVLTTVPASSIKLDEPITVNNITLNKDRKYYIEFLGSKGLCNLLISEEMGNCIICNIGNYTIQAYNNSTNIKLVVIKINEDDTTTDTFTDLIIYEEEVKYLDSKYLETDLVLQNSISLGRIGDIGAGSSAVGYNTTASGDFSHAEGDNTIASASGTHAEGGNTTASGMNSHAEGDSTTASGDYSHAEGSTTTASGVNSHAEGDYTEASGLCSHAEGYGNKASSQFQHVQGKYNIEDTNRRYAHIVGNGAGDAKRSNAHTLDWKGNAWYSGKLSQEGTPTEDKDLTTKKYVDDNKIAYTVSSKKLTTVPASNIKIYNELTVNNISINKDRRYYIEFLGSKKLCRVFLNEENETSTSIICSIGNYIIQAYNDSTNMILVISKINEDDTTATTFTDLVIYEEEVKHLDNKYIENDLQLQNSISLGRVGDIGVGSSAIGVSILASGECSHAEGSGTKASGMFSHAEGSTTTASGMASHAEGSTTTGSGDYSHAEGSETVASGMISHAEGNNTVASSDYQHVQGRYNVVDSNGAYAHIVGNGEDDSTRANAHTLDWEGNAWFAGKVTAGAAPVEDMDLTTKKYVDDKVASLPQLSFNEAGELVVTINGVSKTFVPKS